MIRCDLIAHLVKLVSELIDEIAEADAEIRSRDCERFRKTVLRTVLRRRICGQRNNIVRDSRAMTYCEGASTGEGYAAVIDIVGSGLGVDRCF
jgi:hypothetical protein